MAVVAVYFAALSLKSPDFWFQGKWIAERATRILYLDLGGFFWVKHGSDLEEKGRWLPSECLISTIMLFLRVILSHCVQKFLKGHSWEDWFCGILFFISRLERCMHEVNDLVHKKIGLSFQVCTYLASIFTNIAPLWYSFTWTLGRSYRDCRSRRPQDNTTRGSMCELLNMFKLASFAKLIAKAFLKDGYCS